MHRTTVAGDARRVEQAQQVAVNGASDEDRDRLHRRRSPPGQIVQPPFQLYQPAPGGLRALGALGTTVGDDRESLLAQFRLASARPRPVIVNGGLGPTVDDLFTGAARARVDP